MREKDAAMRAALVQLFEKYPASTSMAKNLREKALSASYAYNMLWWATGSGVPDNTLISIGTTLGINIPEHIKAADHAT